MKCLLNGCLCVEGEARIDFGRDLARDNLQNLAAELNEQSVEGGINLFIHVFALLQS